MKTLRAVLVSAIILAATFAPARAAEPQVVTSTLPNGLTLVAKSEPGSGLVALDAFVRAGAAQERTFEVGIANLVAKTLLASTRNLRAEKLAAIADEVGGNFEVRSHPDYTEIRAITTSGKFDEAMNLLGEVLTNARFDGQAVEATKVQILAELERKQDEVFETAYDEIRLQLYEDSPYRRPPFGYPSTLKKLGAPEVQGFFDKYYVPNNIVISVAGDITGARVEERAKLAFAGIGRKPLPVDRGIPDEKMAKSRMRAMQRDIRLAYFMIGFLAPGLDNPDFPAMAVTAAALGGGKSSRMFRNLRDKRGIGYDLGTLYPKLEHQSHLLAYLITNPFKLDTPDFTTTMALEEAKQALLSEVTDLQRKPLTDEELTRAKRYCIGTYALEHQRLRERAYQLGWLEAVGAGYGFDSRYAALVDGVTKADVQRVVAKYLGNYAAVVILPQDSSPEGQGN